MIPIGIVTRNRAAYLDVTLRSLSATQLPADQQVTVFDDCSDDDSTRRYLYTAGPAIPLPQEWPSNVSSWSQYGLDVLNGSREVAPGLQGKLSVISLGSEPVGVVNASCAALRTLWDMSPKAAAVVLLQDDVVFQQNWLPRLVQCAQRHTNVGLVAGMRLHTNAARTADLLMGAGSNPTAQCLLVTRRGWDVSKSWVGEQHRHTMRFDDMFCEEIRNQAAVWLLGSAMGQHFGDHSLVRPGKRWQSRGGRVDSTCRGPYAIQDEIRQFQPGGAK